MNYTFRLRLVLLIRIYFDKNLIPTSTSNKYSDQIKIVLKSSQFTKYVQHQVLHQMQLQMHKFCYFFSFFYNFKLKSEVIIYQKSLLMTEVNRFGVIGLRHSHKGVLLSHVAEFLFQKLQFVQKDRFLCIREKH